MERCIHCLKETECTRDHVFPKQWYPDNTPETLQRPVAPACSDCNNALGRLETKLFKKMAMCVDHKKAEASGIKKKLFTDLGFGIDLRLLSPKKLKEIEIRRAAAKKLLDSAEPYTKDVKPFPGLGPAEGYPLESLKMIPVPEEELLPVSEKIIRGLEYHYRQRYVEEPYRLDIHFVDSADISEVEKLLTERLPDIYGPGFKVERLHTAEDPDTVLYRVTVWGTIQIYGSIIPPDIAAPGYEFR